MLKIKGNSAETRLGERYEREIQDDTPSFLSTLPTVRKEKMPKKLELKKRGLRRWKLDHHE